jgi:hypothetical protein
MPAVAGMQVKAVMHVVAMTPATRNRKNDINSMTATTASKSTIESYKTAIISRDPYATV